MGRYVLGIDQSTQGTKALLFDEEGKLRFRSDLLHRQIVDGRGFVEHNLEEIYANTVQAVKNLINGAGIAKEEICVLGISNQRETAACWEKESGRPVCNAVVWQCARGADICRQIAAQGFADQIKACTGLQLSPYFTAAKLSWIFQNEDGGQGTGCKRRNRLRNHRQLFNIPADKREKFPDRLFQRIQDAAV